MRLWFIVVISLYAQLLLPSKCLISSVIYGKIAGNQTSSAGDCSRCWKACPVATRPLLRCSRRIPAGGLRLGACRQMEVYCSLLLNTCVSLIIGFAAGHASSRFSWRAGRRRRVRRRATELVHQLLDKVLREGFVLVRPGKFCSLARAQGLVRVATMSLVLHFTMDTADRVVEARAAKDLSLACQSVGDLKIEASVSTRTRSTM